ncbi:MAG TPA: serine protease [Ktedonobacterales bacterium]
MRKRPLATRHAPQRRRARGLLAFTAALALALCSSLAGVAHAQGPLGGETRAPGGRLSDAVVRAVDVAAPAVMRISTIYQSHITMNVCGKTITLPESAAGYPEGALGTGAFVSANGDILTADHLITVDHATLEQQFLADPAAEADIARALDASPCYSYGPVVAPADIANGFLQSSGVTYTTTFTAPKTWVWRNTWYSGALPTPAVPTPDLRAALMGVPHLEATTLASSDLAHDDLALLHVDATDTPSIQLGDSANTQALDTLTVIGFPANGDTNNDPTNLLTPSFNLASVSAIKTASDGAELIQVGGNIEHGDSGGPALDASGRIVGVVSFGGPDNQGMTAFLRSSASAQRLLAAAGVSARPGAFERAWEQAFADYAATSPGHWGRAAHELAALLKAYPQFQGVAPYATWATAQARHEPAAAPSSQQARSPLLLGALGLVAALDLALIALTLLLAARGEPLSRAGVARALRRAPVRPRADEPLTTRNPVLLDTCDQEMVHTTARLN